MDFLTGLVIGWFTAPYVAVASIIFLFGFPVIFWGQDIYDDHGWKYGLWRTPAFLALSVAILHFFTPFEAAWLITGEFWSSALNIALYFLVYVVIGLLFSYLRFYFYAREYNKRMIKSLGANPSKSEMDRWYDNRLSGYGSRISLIMKWIFHWPWCLFAWVLTDVLSSFLNMVRKLFGGRFGAIARSTEPEWMRLREKEEKSREQV